MDEVYTWRASKPHDAGSFARSPIAPDCYLSDPICIPGGLHDCSSYLAEVIDSGFTLNFSS